LAINLRTLSFVLSSDCGIGEAQGEAIINAKFQIRQRRYHQGSKPPNFKSANVATNLTFDFGGYD